MSAKNLPIDLLRLQIEGTELTKREKDVLRLFAFGHTHISAARELGLHTDTVRIHTKAARARLNAKTITHAVAIAVSLDLI